MGKGDKRTRRGKIWRGTYGKCRPKPKKIRRLKKQLAIAQAQGDAKGRDGNSTS